MQTVTIIETYKETKFSNYDITLLAEFSVRYYKSQRKHWIVHIQV